VPNKEEERSRLRLIYREEEFESIDDYDPFPDFILRRLGHPPFGLEVTDFYHSETMARLDKDPNYGDELMRGGRPRHKDDIETAQVVTVEFNPGEPDSWKTEAIFVELPPLSDYAQLLSTRIRKESRKAFASAPGYLSHINLLIVDRDDRLGGTSVQEVCRHIFTPDMKRALIETPYREVFLVTSVKERGECYFPLRAVFLMSEAFGFNRALDTFYTDTGIHSWDEDVELCAEFLKRRGADVGVAVGRHNRLEVIFANAGLAATDERVEVFDYFDYPLPVTRPPAPTPESCKLLTPEFFQFFDDLSLRKFFSSGLAYPIAQQA
jgi:hypothetical protein